MSIEPTKIRLYVRMRSGLILGVDLEWVFEELLKGRISSNSSNLSEYMVKSWLAGWLKTEYTEKGYPPFVPLNYLLQRKVNSVEEKKIRVRKN